MCETFKIIKTIRMSEKKKTLTERVEALEKEIKEVVNVPPCPFNHYPAELPVPINAVGCGINEYRCGFCGLCTESINGTHSCSPVGSITN